MSRTHLYLQLVVTSHECACGHRWEHSHLALTSSDMELYGSTPLPAEETQLSLNSVRLPRHTSQHHYCTKCIPPNVPLISAAARFVPLKPKAPDPTDADDLDHLA